MSTAVFVQTCKPKRCAIMAWMCGAACLPFELTHIVNEYAGFLRLEACGPPFAFRLHTTGMTKEHEEWATFAGREYPLYIRHRVPLFGHIDVDSCTVGVCMDSPAFLPHARAATCPTGPAAKTCDAMALCRLHSVVALDLIVNDIHRMAKGMFLKTATASRGKPAVFVAIEAYRLSVGLRESLSVRFAVETKALSLAVDVGGCGPGVVWNDKGVETWVLVATEGGTDSHTGKIVCA